jgi:leader peptidase (prepilin peptidase)/N-methyltransferase
MSFITLSGYELSFIEVILLVFSVILGSCFGSFINAAALRALDGRDWVRAPSVCFSCGSRLTVSQNLPFWGWLRTGGVAQCCGAKIPRQYVLVEAVGAALAGVFWILLGYPQALVFLPFFIVCGVIFLTDLAAFHIPDWASLGGLAAGLVLALAGAPGLPDFTASLFGGVAGFALLYAINLCYRLIRGTDGLGFGDVKLMAMFGVWLGPLALLPVLFAASIMGTLVGLGVILSRSFSGKYDANGQAEEASGLTMLPFGCFLVPTALLCVALAAILDFDQTRLILPF